MTGTRRRSGAILERAQLPGSQERSCDRQADPLFASPAPETTQTGAFELLLDLRPLAAESVSAQTPSLHWHEASMWWLFSHQPKIVN